MWQGWDVAGTERALADRVAHPRSPAPPTVSAWSKLGAFLAAPVTGAAQGINESARVAARLLSAPMAEDPPERRSADPVMEFLLPGSGERIAAMRAEGKKKHEETIAEIDQQLRSGADYWRPDARTATVASQFLHEASRFVGKAVGYGSAGGVPGIVAGASIDEGSTAYLELRDKGVDATTAAKVGAVRGGMTALSTLAPVAGSTALRTAGIVGVTGPGAFMAEQAMSREILQRAGYRERAAEHDPFDPAGLALSLIPGAVVGGAVHAVRARRAKPDASGIDGPPLDMLADDPDVVAAAHVQLRRDAIDEGMLAPRTDLVARQAHVAALDEARAALDEGRPIELGELPVDPLRAAAVEADVLGKMRASLDSLPPDEGQALGAAGARRVQLEVAPDPLARPEVAEAVRLLDELGGRINLRDDVVFERALAETTRDPLLHNLIVGLAENDATPVAQRRLLDEFVRRADAAASSGRTDLYNVAADIVEEMRRGVDGRAAPDGPMQRAQIAAAERPALPVRLTEEGPAAPAAELLATERAIAQRELSEGRRAYDAAINCVLKFGD